MYRTKECTVSTILSKRVMGSVNYKGKEGGWPGRSIGRNQEWHGHQEVQCQLCQGQLGHVPWLLCVILEMGVEPCVSKV